VDSQAGAPTGFTAKKNDVDCTNQVTETGNGLKFRLKAGETIHIDFDADSTFRCEVTEDDSSKLTGITGTGGTADMAAKKFTTTSGIAKVTFTNGTEPPPPPDKPDEPTPTPGKAILFKRDANTNKGVGPATFKFSSVTNGVYEFDTNASGELETIQWWDPTEKAGKYIKPGEYTVSELIPPPNYLPTTEVQQIKLELDSKGNPIPAGPLVFKNQAKVGLRILKYDRQSHQPMNNVKARETILTLAGYFRQALSINEPFVSLEQELSNIRNYLALTEARFQDAIHVTWDLPDVLPVLYLPPLILQPIVENAVRHGGTAVDDRHVNISIQQGDGRVDIRVSDRGHGFPEEILKRLQDPRDPGYTGLFNVQKRLRSVYGSQCVFTVDSSEQGSTVAVSIPLIPPGGLKAKQEGSAAYAYRGH